MSPFLEALHSGRVLLMDGAMGTELQRAGIVEGECYELWNLTHPEKVQAIHQAYVDAGAEVLLTNTFQANRVALARHGLQARLHEINKAGVEIARSVAGPSRYVLGDIGPLPHRSKGPWDAEAVERLGQTIKSLDGCDAILLDTWSDCWATIAILNLAYNPSMRIPPCLFSAAYYRDAQGRVLLFESIDPEYYVVDCGMASEEIPAVAVGANCGNDIGMDEIIEIVRRYRATTTLPLFARPNAGTPTRVGDRWVYPLTPENMAERLPESLEAGVSMVGGCCGTTPEHIAAMKPIVDAWNKKTSRKR